MLIFTSDLLQIASSGSVLNRCIIILFQINTVDYIIYFNPLAASSDMMDLKLLHPTWPKLSTSSVHALRWHDCTKLLIWDFKLKQKVCHNYFNKAHSFVNPFILPVQEGRAISAESCGLMLVTHFMLAGNNKCLFLLYHVINIWILFGRSKT